MKILQRIMNQKKMWIYGWNKIRKILIKLKNKSAIVDKIIYILLINYIISF